MATSVVFPRVQFFADNGRLLIGGRIHTYIAGTSSRAPTYKDAARAQPNTNPIILDGRAEASIYLAEGVEYKFVVEDSKGAMIMTQEPVYGAIWPNAEDWPSDATLAYQYMLEAKAAASAIGPIKFYDTYAQADNDLPDLSEDDLVEIAQDENKNGARTRYRVESGALVFVVSLGRPSELTSVMDFSAVGDGITDDTLAVQAAINHCVSNVDQLYWPAGTYLTTANILNLHSVRHVGAGAILRGSDTFYPDPTNSQTNRLYVATTGNDANDGLSASESVADYGVHFTRLSNYGPILPGSWSINLAAGTYNISTTKSIPQFLKTRNRLTLRGPVVEHPGVPTAIIDGGGAAVSGVSYLGQAEIGVEYVRFQGCKPSVGGGIYVADGANLYTNNVHADDCRDGIYAIRSSVIRIQGGVISNCTQGIVCSIGAFGAIGFGSASTATGPIIENCATGVSLGEASSCHVDYAIIRGNNIGILVYDNSRSNVVASDLRNNTVGIETRTGGVYADTGIVWNVGTGLANTTKARIRGQQQILPTIMRPVQRAVFNRSSTLTLTGSTALTPLTTNLLPLPAGWLVEEDRLIKVELYGVKTGAAGNANIVVTLGGTTVINAQLPDGTAAQVFRLVGWIVCTGPAAQRSWFDVSNNFASGSNRISTYVGTSVDMTTAKALDISAQLANGADSIQVVGISVELTG